MSELSNLQMMKDHKLKNKKELRKCLKLKKGIRDYNYSYNKVMKESLN